MYVCMYVCIIIIIINHIVLKITEVVKNSGLSTGLFRDNTRRKNKHKRKTKQCVWFTAECEKKRKAFSRAKNQHMRLQNSHTTEIRAQTSREYKKEVNKQFRKIRVLKGNDPKDLLEKY